MNEMMVWNIVLTVLLAVVGYIANEKFKELGRLGVLLNRTREEFARDHITRAEVREDMEKLFERLDSLNNKLDIFIREQKSAIR
jgi:hypothetical protein